MLRFESVEFAARAEPSKLAETACNLALVSAGWQSLSDSSKGSHDSRLRALDPRLELAMVPVEPHLRSQWSF